MLEINGFVDNWTRKGRRSGDGTIPVPYCAVNSGRARTQSTTLYPPFATPLTRPITMVSIHHEYFLHIIDAIFDYAEPAALAIMARTCRKWRHRCLSQFYVLHEFCYIDQSPVAAIETRNRFDRVQLLKGNAELALLAGCKVIDIDTFFRPQPLWHADVDTVRFRRGLETDITFEILPLPVRQIVCQNVAFSFEFRQPAVKSLVVHCAEPDASLLSWNHEDVGGEANLTGLSGLERFVLIFEDVLEGVVEYEEEEQDTVSESSSSYTLNPDFGPQVIQLRTTRNLIAAARQQGAIVFLVGTESFSPDAVAALELGSECTLESYENALKSSHPIHRVTLESYRRSLSEQEWAIQTCWDKPIHP